MAYTSIQRNFRGFNYQIDYASKKSFNEAWEGGEAPKTTKKKRTTKKKSS